ncbi:MAG: hypothetical protein ACFB01_09695 [Cohaesibacteraceae bacterium]
MINRVLSPFVRYARSLEGAWAFAEEMKSNARIANTLGVRSGVAGLWAGYRG